MIKIKSMLKILENWLGMSNAAEIFYIGGSDVLPCLLYTSRCV